jgi:hypothetical protein
MDTEPDNLLHLKAQFCSFAAAVFCLKLADRYDRNNRRRKLHRFSNLGCRNASRDLHAAVDLSHNAGRLPRDMQAFVLHIKQEVTMHPSTLLTGTSY